MGARMDATLEARLEAEDFDCEAPGPNYQLQFPRDHHFHPRMGVEWYYVGLILQVTDPAGVAGRGAVLLDLNKERIVGGASQQEFGVGGGCPSRDVGWWRAHG